MPTVLPSVEAMLVSPTAATYTNYCGQRRMPSCGMWCRVDLVNWTDVSEERMASIFRVEKSSFSPLDSILYQLWPATCWPTDPFLLLSIDFPCGPHSLPSHSYKAGCFRLVAQSAATCSRWLLARGFLYPEDVGNTSSETSVQFRRSIRRHISEDGILHSHRRENLKSLYCGQNSLIGRAIILPMYVPFALNSILVSSIAELGEA
jgi:hypothetical protein